MYICGERDTNNTTQQHIFNNVVSLYSGIIICKEFVKCSCVCMQSLLFWSMKEKKESVNFIVYIKCIRVIVKNLLPLYVLMYREIIMMKKI